MRGSLESDMEAGVKLHSTNVLASKDIIVSEAEFENPRDDPLHCPPATTSNSKIFSRRSNFSSPPRILPA